MTMPYWWHPVRSTWTVKRMHPSLYGWWKKSGWPHGNVYSLMRWTTKLNRWPPDFWTINSTICWHAIWRLYHVPDWTNSAGVAWQRFQSVLWPGAASNILIYYVIWHQRRYINGISYRYMIYFFGMHITYPLCVGLSGSFCFFAT